MISGQIAKRDAERAPRRVAASLGFLLKETYLNPRLKGVSPTGDGSGGGIRALRARLPNHRPAPWLQTRSPGRSRKNSEGHGVSAGLAVVVLSVPATRALR